MKTTILFFTLSLLLFACKKDETDDSVTPPPIVPVTTPLNITIIVTNNWSQSQALGAIMVRFKYIADTTNWFALSPNVLAFGQSSTATTDEDNRVHGSWWQQGSGTVKEGNYKWWAGNSYIYGGNEGTCTLTKNQTTTVVIQ